MILYIENPKDSTRKLLELSDDYSKVVGYKINARKSLAFVYTKNVKQQEKLRKQSHSPVQWKEKIVRNKFAWRTKRSVYIKL